MTVKDLLTTNCTISLLEIEVRDNGKLVEIHRIGLNAKKYQGEQYIGEQLYLMPTRIPVYIVNESINHRTSGKDYWGAVLKPIGEFADREVDRWSATSDYYTKKELVGDFVELRVAVPLTQLSLKLGV